MKRKRMTWKFQETQDMLSIIQRKHLRALLNNSTKHNYSIYDDVSKELAKRGSEKNVEQIRCKFKFIKCFYYKTMRNKGREATKEFFGEHFPLIDKMFGSFSPHLEDEQTISLSELKGNEDLNDDLEDGIIQFIDQENDRLGLTEQEECTNDLSDSEKFEEKPTSFSERLIQQPLDVEDSLEDDGISMCMKSLTKDIKDASLPHLELMKLKQKLTNTVYDFLLNSKTKQ